MAAPSLVAYKTKAILCQVKPVVKVNRRVVAGRIGYRLANRLRDIPLGLQTQAAPRLLCLTMFLVPVRYQAFRLAASSQEPRASHAAATVRHYTAPIRSGTLNRTENMQILCSHLHQIHGHHPAQIHRHDHPIRAAHQLPPGRRPNHDLMQRHGWPGQRPTPGQRIILGGRIEA